MASYLSRVRVVTGSTTTQTSNAAVVDFLKGAVNYVIQSIPKEMLWFANTEAALTSSAGVTIPRDTIISVKRNGVECDKLNDKFVYATSTTLTSLYAGTAFFPKYYITSGKVYIHPTPTTGAAGAVTYVNLSSTLITTSITATGVAISPIENPFLNYATGLDFQGLAGYWGQKAGEVTDAFDKAKYLVDSATNLTQGEDIEDMLEAEDTELVSSGVQVAGLEQNRGTANLNFYNSKSQLCQAKSKEMFVLAEKQIEQYVKSQGGAKSQR